MNKFTILCSLLLLTGCANFNPRNQPKIDNNGKIDDIKTNQNGIMAEIGKLRQDVQIQNSKLKEIQNGLLNVNAAISRNENTGVQIIQGDGALIFVFSLIVIAMLLFWYRDRAIKSEKTAEMMAREIAKFNDPALNDAILASALKNNNAKQVYSLLRRYVEE